MRKDEAYSLGGSIVADDTSRRLTWRLSILSLLKEQAKGN